MKQVIIKGNLNLNNAFADVIVDLEIHGKSYKNKKAFIDTGASVSLMNENLIPKIDLDNYEVENLSSINGSFPARKIKQVNILMMEVRRGIPLEEVHTAKLENGYDLIIGNDILCMCEFKYNGFKKNYELTFFNDEKTT